MLKEEIKQNAVDNGFGKKSDKQIIGITKIKHFGEKAQYEYVLEDDTKVLEDEDGKKLSKINYLKTKK